MLDSVKYSGRPALWLEQNKPANSRDSGPIWIILIPPGETKRGSRRGKAAGLLHATIVDSIEFRASRRRGISPCVVVSHHFVFFLPHSHPAISSVRWSQNLLVVSPFCRDFAEFV